MKIVTQLLLILTLLSTGLSAQNSHHHTPGHVCGFDHKMKELQEKNPELLKQRKEYIERIIPEILENQAAYRTQAILKVPVVFHVIHNGEPVGVGQNLSEQTILEQLQTLNEDFQAMNDDFLSTPDRFANAIGNPEIQFCLAEIDPNGSDTNGITRHQFSNVTDDNIEATIKPSTSWDAYRYYNIWILPIPETTNQGGTTGYAYLPFPGTIGDPSTDGTVLDYRFTGAGATTLTHETGHYLGLYHTWGVNDGGCGVVNDDGFTDTPEQSNPTSQDVGFGFNCFGGTYPTGPSSCGEEHMYVNYMDYASSSCLTSFTNQQIAVMRAVLMGTVANPTPVAWGNRNLLLQSAPEVAPSCDGTVTDNTFDDDAGLIQIVAPALTVCAGQEIEPIVELQNQFGENDLTSARIRYRINGTNTTNFNWTGNLEKGESKFETLPSFIAPDSDFTFTVSTSNPNGQVDEWEFNDELEITVSVNVSQPAPLIDDFETNALDPTASGLTSINYDEDPFVWQHTSAVSGFGIGAGSIYFDNFNGLGVINPDNTTDAIVTPPLDMTAAVNTELTFDVAYATYGELSTQYSDGLEVRISTDCGATFSEMLYFKEGDELSTVDGPYPIMFQPTADDWRKESIDLSNYADETALSIIFINHSGYGNLLYLDNINIGAGCSAQVNAQIQEVTCFGECDGTIQLEISGFDEAYTVQWGENANNQTGTETLENLCPGEYSVTVSDGEACEIVQTISLLEPPSIQVEAISTDVTAVGASDGFVGVYPAALGINNFTYQWNTPNMDISPEVSDLAAGEYIVTITAEGIDCPTIDTLIVNEFDCSSFALAEITSTPITCFGSDDGKASISVTGGFMPYFYQWNNSILIEPSQENLPPGDYEVTVTDLKGCWIIESFTIDEPEPMDMQIAITPESGVGQGDASIFLLPSGGTPDYMYEWSDGQTTNPATNLEAATYTVTVTDSNGCQLYQDITIEEVACMPVQLEVATTNVSCGGASDGIALVTPVGSEATYTYSIGQGDNDNSFENLSADTYTVVATDEFGCSSTTNFIIEEPELLSTQIASQPTCFESASGNASAIVFGGTTPYTYAWSNGSQEQSITGLAAGDYTITITDANACTMTSQVTVESYEAINVEIQINNESQQNANDGAIATSVSGGTAPYTYIWSNEATTASISDLAPGFYAYTITDANACIVSQNEIEVLAGANPCAAFAAEGTQVNVSCAGGTNGSINLTIDNNTDEYAILWDDGSTTPTLQNLSAGIYEVTLSNSSGCTIEQSYGITEPSPLGVEIMSQDETFENFNDGSINANANGGTPPYIYNWGDAGQGESLAGLAPGSYILTLTDVNQCIVVEEVFINPGISPCLTFGVEYEVNNIDCNGENTGNIQLFPSNDIELNSYLWSNGATTPNLAEVGAGVYTVSVTSNNNCSQELEIVVAEAPAIEVQVSSQNESELGANDGSIELAVAGGTPDYAYLWSNDNTTNSDDNLAPGLYIITVSDDNNCQTILEVEIEEGNDNCLGFEAGFEVQNVSCFGESDGQIVLNLIGGMAPFDYEWSDGSIETMELMDVAAGLYSVTISDANNCDLVLEIEVAQPDALSLIADVQDESVLGANDGSISLVVSGGTAAYTYQWSNGATTSSIQNLESGIYEVLISDANDCTLTETFAIEKGIDFCAGFAADLITTDVSCAGGNDGSIQVITENGTEPFVYEWSGDLQGGSALEGLNAGIYSVLVVDTNNCEFYLETEIIEPSPVVVSYETTPVTLPINLDGSITVEVEGGTPNYNFLWESGETTNMLNNLGVGEYTVTISDQNGCSQETTIPIFLAEPDCTGFETNFQIQEPSCNGENDGMVKIEPVGGVEPYEIQWLNALSGEMQDNLLAGEYPVIVTDAQNCVAQYNVVVSEPAPIQTDIILENGSCGLGGAAEAATVGGVTPYTYEWSTGQAGNEITNLETGTFTLSITDSNGCSEIQSFDIEVDEALAPEFEFETQTISCFGNNDGQISILPVGGNAPFSYQWSNGMTTETIEDLTPGSYTVIIMDNAGCSFVQSVQLFEPTGIFAEISLSTLDNESFMATCIAQGGQPPYQFLWSNGETNIQNEDLTEGSYSVTITDSNGCTIEESILIDNTDTSTNVQDISTLLQFDYFPNPTNDLLNINLNFEAAQEFTLFMYNVVGQAVYQQTNNRKSLQTQISTADFSAGTYLLRLKTQEGIVVKKVVVIK